MEKPLGFTRRHSRYSLAARPGISGQSAVFRLMEADLGPGGTHFLESLNSSRRSFFGFFLTPAAASVGKRTTVAATRAPACSAKARDRAARVFSHGRSSLVWIGVGFRIEPWI